jgi:hypothetical protein
MGRIVKASLDEIARTCAKLQVEGNLPIHSLRAAWAAAALSTLPVACVPGATNSVKRRERL